MRARLPHVASERRLLVWYRLPAVEVGTGNAPAARGSCCCPTACAGPSLRFMAPGVAAICGAEFAAEVDGKPVPLWQSFEVPKGATLSVASARHHPPCPHYDIIHRLVLSHHVHEDLAMPNACVCLRAKRV